MKGSINLIVLIACICIAAGAIAAGPPPIVKIDSPTLIRGDLDCSGAIPLSCGDTVAGSNVGLFNNVEYYLCDFVSWAMTGPESVYEFVLEDFQTVDIHLGDNACDLGLILLASCDEDDCIDSSDVYYDEHITKVLSAGTYYVVVEGYDGAECDFTLSVVCSDLIGDCTMDMLEADCAATQTVGDNCDALDHGPMWDDCGSANGGDEWYPITVGPGGSFQAYSVFGGISTGVAVTWIAESCLPPYGCLDFQSAPLGSFGTNSVSYQNTTAEDKVVYIVVDTIASWACGYYSLIMSCSGDVIRDEALSWGQVKTFYK